MFQPVSERPEYIKWLLYGHPGAGKTKLCADAPGVRWLDFENSTETLRHWPEYANIPVDTPSDIMQIFEIISKAVKDPDTETIVIDSVTSALDFYMRKRAAELAKIVTASGKKRDEFEFYEADYKYATQVFSKLFGILTHAPINVVLIFHERKFRDPDTGEVKAIWPDVTPRLQDSVTRLVNVVGYLESTYSQAKEQATRKLYVNPTNVIEAKNRLNIQKPFIINPEWKTIFS